MQCGSGGAAKSDSYSPACNRHVPAGAEKPVQLQASQSYVHAQDARACAHGAPVGAPGFPGFILRNPTKNRSCYVNLPHFNPSQKRKNNVAIMEKNEDNGSNHEQQGQVLHKKKKNNLRKFTGDQR